MEIKKSRKVRLDLHSRTFFLIGLIISLSIVLYAFEYKSPVERTKLDNSAKVIEWNEPVIQNTERPKPKKALPKIIYQKPEIVKNDEKVPDDDIIVYSSEIDQLSSLYFEKEEEEEDPEIFVEFPSENPEFPGGNEALQLYLKNNTHFPQMAIDYGLEGTVYVQFTIGADGKIRDVKVLRKADPILEEEAIRVIKSMPTWKPAKQGIRSVATYMRLPIRFVLNR